MAKKNKTSKAAKKAEKKGQRKEKEVKKTSSVLEEVEAMSSSDEEPLEQNNKNWNAKAKALKEMIESGSYDKLVAKGKAEKDSKDDNDDDDDESIEEVVLDDEEDNQKNKGNNKRKRKNTKEAETKDSDGQEHSEESEQSDEEEMEDEEDPEEQQQKSKRDQTEEEEIESENSEEEEDNDDEHGVFDTNSKALSAKTAQLQAEKGTFPWAERFDVVPSEPLPFGKADEDTGNKIDIHDDLNREVAFYDVALEAVQLARTKCKQAGIPFARPDDFFAEMVKTDDHMARVKDRLIFENKKIEAVAQRKSNKEQKLRSKEAHSNKIAEKARRKKDNMNFVDDWAKGAASNRGGKYNDQDDQVYLRKMQGRDNNGPNKKRMAANKKYGFGGKRGRFKQNDPKSMNDMSGFNPKGNFGGMGSKRHGKRARDATRKRQKTS
ncbi:processing protein EBP2 [Seminavis robusta]|uniref:Processing protein EBP2 n=1 Tax=Seminavis robusta TaxID=568900 RepID=A0A9N8DN70_9STRA|nr:processing protein EBP2 [Seminavis robusta]|eukprot:Sro229_g093170.1 processing protein EBP2 (435) ;mRNA; f:80070-81462